MAEMMFSRDEIRQIKNRGMQPEAVASQIEIFKRGVPYANLKRPCAVSDGIIQFNENDLERLGSLYSKAALSGRSVKFVPASGAASRMFKSLLSFNSRYNAIDKELTSAKAQENDPEHKSFLEFLKGIKRFAFYDDLKVVMSKGGLDIENLLSKGQFKDILEYLLTPKGLDYAHLPKGLIAFHRYPGHYRTPFEEHLVEAAAYVKDQKGIARVHFTIPADHEKTIRDHIQSAQTRHGSSRVKFEVTFSVQKPSTDTIAVDLDNKPFRDSSGKLIFRPGGHGALLENLNALRGDIVFIKNIDNVVPDRLKQVTYLYKKALGGYLVELQTDIFQYITRLVTQEPDETVIRRGFEFVRRKLFHTPPDGILKEAIEKKKAFLLSKLNRPLRICGTVRNVSEPGGGPFWVEGQDKTLSLQIVESSQVDMKSAQQRATWESSTHFNPVDLVCGVRDYLGRPFALGNFVAPDTSFISIKSKEGRELKALELPGLWNGAMAYWNTVFVEVPLITFNPVKTVNDLLRKEHQPNTPERVSEG